MIKVVFHTPQALRFAQREVVHWKKYAAADEPVEMQVAYFDSFEDIHHTLEQHGIADELWWQNGNDVFSDADAFITIP